MYWFKMSSKFMDDEKTLLIKKELGYQGLYLWIVLLGLMADAHSKKDQKEAQVSERKLCKSVGISPKKLQESITKLSQICNFSYTFVELFYNFYYPKFLKINERFFRKLDENFISRQVEERRKKKEERRETSGQAQPITFDSLKRLKEKNDRERNEDIFS